ncbi:toxin-antitoxin system YwqK family antitoxin [Myroides pelagicus]|uniref:Toxin-antitoxin system YwqK family antitoxin n=1 Tax=Myroides pelagicus TaxID=270914 RepID=A0A7K1GM21_9FLAO|nr:hypothetical protein [Myroides pelagicus]MEC4114721.1 hypothetical protein [Myroides pelagicus]MTH29274.1 hypothetical protein [Myroides pelagicus]
MIKRLLPAVVLSSLAAQAQVAKDTIFTTRYNTPVEKSLALNYTPYNAEKKTIQPLNTYTLENDQLIIKGQGIVSNSKTISYNGKVSYFTPDGKEQMSYMYNEEGEPTNAVSHNIFTGETYQASFRENSSGSLENGKVIQYVNGVYYLGEAEQGIFKQFEYINPASPKEKINFTFDEEGRVTSSQTFDANGNEIEKMNYQDGSPYTGTMSYLAEQDYVFAQTVTYEAGELIAQKHYYSNGQLKSEMKVEGTTKTETYYNKNGEVLGTYTADMTNGYEENYDGQVIYFYDNSTRDIISQIYEYNKGTIVKFTNFYTTTDKNTIQSIITYDAETSNPSHTVYYDKDGKELGNLTYDGYSPQDGTSYEENEIVTYKNGVIISKKVYYPNTKQLIEEQKDNLSIYYAKDGKELGRLTYKADEYYGSSIPYNGTSYLHYGGIFSSVIKYEKGLTTYVAEYETSQGTPPFQLVQETFYSNNTETKKVSYFTNGKVKEVQLLEQDYYNTTPSKSTYYDLKGKEIGTYDYNTNTGVKYEYYSDKQIKSIEKFNAGVATYAKVYIPVEAIAYLSSEDGQEIKYFLAYEIDFNKEGIFYDAQGNIVTKTTYKDGAPYNGKTHILDEYTLTVTPYVNGKKEGKETLSYTYDGSNSPYAINHYEAGELVREETYEYDQLTSITDYKDGLKNGLSQTYNSEGNLLSSMEYKAGEPYNGVLTTDYWQYTSEETYESGKKTKTIYRTADEDKKILAEEYFTNPNTSERKIYDVSGKLMLHYRITNGMLNGTYLNYEDGKLIHQATIKDGILESGQVALRALDYVYDYYSDTEEINEYTVLDYKKNKLKLSIYKAENDELLYNMDAKINKANQALDPILSKKIVPTKLFPHSQFNTDVEESYEG